MPRQTVTKGPQSAGLVNADRLRQTVDLLHEAGERGLTKAQLVDLMGDVSTRTVDRAISLLEEEGAAIQRLRVGHPQVLAFVLKKGPKWDEALTSHARLALEVALQSVEGPALEVWGEQLDAIAQLVDQHLSTRDRRMFDRLKERVVARGSVDDPRPMDRETLTQVLLALGGDPNPFELEIDYTPVSSKKDGWRTVVPFTLVHDVFSGGAFLLAWDVAGRGPRHFRLSRIREAKTTRRMGVIPDRERMERARRYQVGGWFQDREPQAIEVRIHGEHWVQALHEAPPALPDVEVIPAKDGSSLVRFKATEFSAPLRWILQFGSDAEVISPSELRTSMVDRLRAALKGHGEH